jgi:hypothetical protein
VIPFEVDANQVALLGVFYIVRITRHLSSKRKTREVKSFILNWRPRRDLNPCYRRERAVS